MRYLQISCIIICLVIYTLCIPVSKNVLYESIIEKCPSVKTIEAFKEEPIFRSCSSWSETDTINETDIKNVHCSLYFASFIEYCTHNRNLNVTLSKDSIANVLLNTSLKEFCDYAKNITYKKLGTLFNSEENCKKFCIDEIGKFIKPTCGISFYFGHLHTDPPRQDKQDKEPAKKEHDAVLPAQQTIDKHLDEKLVNLNSGKSEIKNGASAVENASPPIVPEVGGDALQMKLDEVAGDAPQIKPDEVAGDAPQIKAEDANTLTHTQKDTAAVNSAIDAENVPQTNAKNVPQTQNKVDNQQEVAPPKSKDSGEQANTHIDSKEKEKIGVPETPIDQNPQDIAEEDVIDDDDTAVMDSSLMADKPSKPIKTDDEPISYTSDVIEGGDSYFFTYFMIFCIIFVLGYVCYHNKQKILALILEGRRGRRPSRGRRPNSANYHKLDSNLEEAISSSCKKNTSNVIY